MAAKKNNAINTLVIIIVVILCVIFMANSWVSSEIEQSNVLSPATAQGPVSSHKLSRIEPKTADNSHIRHQTPSDPSSVEAVGATPKKKKKRQKIIYEIPLDDVNLVQ